MSLEEDVEKVRTEWETEGRNYSLAIMPFRGLGEMSFDLTELSRGTPHTNISVHSNITLEAAKIVRNRLDYCIKELENEHR